MIGNYREKILKSFGAVFVSSLFIHVGKIPLTAAFRRHTLTQAFLYAQN